MTIPFHDGPRAQQRRRSDLAVPLCSFQAQGFGVVASAAGSQCDRLSCIHTSCNRCVAICNQPRPQPPKAPDLASCPRTSERDGPRTPITAAGSCICCSCEAFLERMEKHRELKEPMPCFGKGFTFMAYDLSRLLADIDLSVYFQASCLMHPGRRPRGLRTFRRYLQMADAVGKAFFACEACHIFSRLGSCFKFSMRQLCRGYLDKPSQQVRTDRIKQLVKSLSNNIVGLARVSNHLMCR